MSRAPFLDKHATFLEWSNFLIIPQHNLLPYSKNQQVQKENEALDT